MLANLSIPYLSIWRKESYGIFICYEIPTKKSLLDLCCTCYLSYDQNSVVPVILGTKKLKLKGGTKIYYIKYMANLYPAIACSKLTIETLEQGVKYVQS